MCKALISLFVLFATVVSSFRRPSLITTTATYPFLSPPVFRALSASVTSIPESDVTGTVLLSNKACETTIGLFQIIAEECDDISSINLENVLNLEKDIIRLMDVGSGWGNGAHPTTKLCMNFIQKIIRKGDKLLDYGTGSGILSIAAAKLGASHCIAVDIDEDTLVAAEMNGRVNGVSDILDVVHTRSVYVGEERFPISDVTVANILPGPLSMLSATLWSFTAPGGIMCLSGMRPHELPAIRKIYIPFVDLETEEINSDSHHIYGKVKAGVKS
jgi:hypothetical protein